MVHLAIKAFNLQKALTTRSVCVRPTRAIISHIKYSDGVVRLGHNADNVL